MALAAHAAEAGAAAVAVIGPPYFQLDERALPEHFVAAAAACAPVPFYVYEFERAAATRSRSLSSRAARTGAEPRRAQGLRRAVRPFAPYLLEGLDVFVGPEALIFAGHRGGRRRRGLGARGRVPDRVAAVVREPTAGGRSALGELRAAVERSRATPR